MEYLVGHIKDLPAGYSLFNPKRDNESLPITFVATRVLDDKGLFVGYAFGDYWIVKQNITWRAFDNMIDRVYNEGETEVFLETNNL